MPNDAPFTDHTTAELPAHAAAQHCSTPLNNSTSPFAALSAAFNPVLRGSSDNNDANHHIYSSDTPRPLTAFIGAHSATGFNYSFVPPAVATLIYASQQQTPPSPALLQPSMQRQRVSASVLAAEMSKLNSGSAQRTVSEAGFDLDEELSHIVYRTPVPRIRKPPSKWEPDEASAAKMNSQRCQVARNRQDSPARMQRIRSAFPVLTQQQNRERNTALRQKARSDMQPEAKKQTQEQNTMQHRRRRRIERLEQHRVEAEIVAQHVSGEALPSIEFLNLYDKNVLAAQARFAQGSGFDLHNDIFLHPSVVLAGTAPEVKVLSEEDVAKMTNLGPVSDEQLMSAMRKFMQTTDSAQQINACASCGITGFENSDPTFTRISLVSSNGDFNDTKFPRKSSAHAHASTLLEIFLIGEDAIPMYTTGRYCTVRTSAKVNGHLFYLHDHLLLRGSGSDDAGVIVPLCEYCTKAVTRGCLPEFNVKHRDFGNLAEYQRLVLGGKGRSLSVAERSVTARSVVFDTVIKYAGDKAQFHKGHCISFKHNGAIVLDNILPRTSSDQLSKYISVAFVGKDAKHLHAADLAKSRSNFFSKRPMLRIRAAACFAFLAFKKEMDPLYHDVEFLPFSLELAEQLESIPELILQSAVIVDSEREVAIDASIHDDYATAPEDRTSRDPVIVTEPQTDVSDSRVHSPVQKSTPTSDDESSEDDQLENDEMPPQQQMQQVFIAPKVVHPTCSSRAFLETIQRQCIAKSAAPTQDVEQQDTDEPGLFELIAESHAEGTDDDHDETSGEMTDSLATSTSGMYAPSSLAADDSNTPHGRFVPMERNDGVGPVHALLVDALPNCQYTQNKELLLSSFPELFLLGTGLGESVNAKLSQRELNHLLRQHDGRFGRCHQFLFLLFDQMQRATLALQATVKVRGGMNAVKAFGDIVNAPGFASRLECAIQHPTSADAKKLTTLLNGVTQIVNSQVPWSEDQRTHAKSKLLSLIYYAGPFSFFVTIAPAHLDSVLALRISGLGTPKSTPGGAVGSAYNNGDREINVNFQLPSGKNRFYNCADDPCAYAQIYKLLMQAFLEHLVGRPPQHLTLRDPVLTDTSYTGIFGTVTTYGFVNEEQAKGPEHAHGLVNSDISPITLEKYLGEPAVLIKLYERFDSIVKAHIPNFSDASYLADVLSTHKAGFSGKILTPSRRDLRYQPDESHSIEVMDASASAQARLLRHEIATVPSDSVTLPTMDIPSASTDLQLDIDPSDSTKMIADVDDIIYELNEEQGMNVSEQSAFDEETRFNNTMRRAFACAIKNNVHHHSFTCHKGATGTFKCRMSYPRATNNRSTGLVELEADVKTGQPRARTHFSTRVTTTDPLQDLQDSRTIILDLIRPSESYNKLQQSDYDSIPQDDPYWVEYDSGPNADIVSFSPALTAMFGCNSNVDVLGNFAQSKSATYYLIKYLTKDGNRIKTIIPVLLAAERKVKAYPSRAEDVGTSFRNTTHILNVMINSLNGGVEIAAETAALALLGLPSNIFSHGFDYLYVRPATALLRLPLCVFNPVCSATPSSLSYI